MKVSPQEHSKMDSKSIMSSAELVQTEPFCSSSEVSNSSKSVGDGSSSSINQMSNLQSNRQMNMQTQNEMHSHEQLSHENYLHNQGDQSNLSREQSQHQESPINLSSDMMHNQSNSHVNSESDGRYGV